MSTQRIRPTRNKKSQLGIDGISLAPVAPAKNMIF